VPDPSRSNPPQATALTARVASLSHDGRGVARTNAEVVFVDGALPGEEIRYVPIGKRRRQIQGRLQELIVRSPDRVEPPCEYFGICGGCALQHLAYPAQLRIKHQQLVDNLQRIGKVAPEEWMPALAGNEWGYRRKARLGVRNVPKKGGVLVGFRERRRSYVTPLAYCRTLDPGVARLLPTLPELVSGLSCAASLPQIEVAVADNAIALVFRHLVPMLATDVARLRDYASGHGIQIFLQPEGLDSIHPVWPAEPEALHYHLAEWDLTLWFGPADFIQVNREMNQKLVGHVLECLRLGPGDSVLELFSGIGNFTLPLARHARHVCAIEGDQAATDRARFNADRNRIDNVSFLRHDLYRENPDSPWLLDQYDKVLLDPPRTGAMEVIKQLPAVTAKRIVYVSCNPATLARDAELLVHKHGYRLVSAGIVDMFPHTMHVESVAVFDAQ